MRGIIIGLMIELLVASAVIVIVNVTSTANQASILIIDANGNPVRAR